jgi:ribonuclease J
MGEKSGIPSLNSIPSTPFWLKVSLTANPLSVLSVGVNFLSYVLLKIFSILKFSKLKKNQVLTIDIKNKTIPTEPQVVSRGFIYMKDSGDLTRQFTNAAKNFLLNELKQPKMINLQLLQKSVTEYMTKIIVEETDRKPMVVPIFMQLNE